MFQFCWKKGNKKNKTKKENFIFKKKKILTKKKKFLLKKGKKEILENGSFIYKNNFTIINKIH